MASKTFSPGTTIDSAWLNDVNTVVYYQSSLQAAPTLTITTNTITPVNTISFVGAGLIKTITVPANMSGTGGSIKIIPTAAFTTDTTGNIALASTAVINRVLEFVYDGVTGKWYPSY